MAQSAQIAKLSHRHEAILHFMIANPTVPASEVARRFNVTQAWLSVVKNSDAFLEARHRYTEEVFHETVLPIREKLMVAADLALDRMIELTPMETDLEKVRKTTDSVLAACGYTTGSGEARGAGPTHNTQNNFFFGNASAEVLNRARAMIGKPQEEQHVVEGFVVDSEETIRRIGDESGGVETIDSHDNIHGSIPGLVRGDAIRNEEGSSGDPQQNNNELESINFRDGSDSSGAERELDSGHPQGYINNDDQSLLGGRDATSYLKRPGGRVEVTVHGTDW
jgi:hypothetical protein